MVWFGSFWAISHVVLVQLFPILNPLDCYNKAWLLLDNAFTVTLPQDRKRCQMGSTNGFYTIFTMHYARSFYKNRSKQHGSYSQAGGLDFPGDDEPD